MRKIVYPDPVKMAVLLKEYENIFSLDNTTMQNKWVYFRDKLRRLSTSLSPNVLYPDNITDVFTMPYPTLVEMYLDYVQIRGTGKNKNEELLHENLSKLFHYSGQKNPFVSAYQRKIAKFWRFWYIRMLLLRNKFYQHIWIHKYIQESGYISCSSRY